MRPRAPITLWLYLLNGLWKLILLTTGVLVSVLAFAAAVKLLADGRLGPVDTIRFMGFAIPPMLQYALPFAAGFGATLAYHALAANNEVTACQAGGIGYRSLLTPGLLTGLALTALLMALSNQAIPSLLRSMQELAYQDVTRYMIHSIERGEAVDLGGGRKFLAADSVDSRGPDEKSGAYQVLWLKGVLFAELDKNGDAEREGTADSAWVWFIRLDDEDVPRLDAAASRATGADRDRTAGTTLVKVRLERCVTHQQGSGKMEVGDLAFEQRIPTPLRDDPKFLSWRELRQVRGTPEMIAPVNALRRQLATVLAERASTERLSQSLRTDGAARLEDTGGQRVTLRGAGLTWSPDREMYRVLSPQGPDGSVRVDRTLGAAAGDREQRHTAKRVWLRSVPSADSPGREVPYEIKMEEVATTGASAEAPVPRLDAAASRAADAPTPAAQSPVAGIRREMTIAGLTLAAPAAAPVQDMMSLSCADLLAAADTRVAAFDWEKDQKYSVGPYRDSLRQRIERLLREVEAKEHERAAIALSCLVMILTGSVMAMRLKESLPLTVYLWSFGPALGSVITIMSGQQLMRQHGVVGIPVLWSGVGGMGLFAMFEYIKLRKH